jgi:light-regulated signal transduction histidine kinase (bacteriophytochrome)
MAEINEQLGAAPNLDIFLKVVAGVIKDLTQFHRVLLYQFDEAWNGQTVAELVDWSVTHDLYKGLHFPASDIPAQVSNCLLACSYFDDLFFLNRRGSYMP